MKPLPWLACWFASAALLQAADFLPRKPDVLFLAIDDMNDWVGCLGGNVAAHTPNLDALAARGTVFLNAHCQAPLCNPSRTSLMTGMRPSSSGIYGLAPWFRSVEALRDRVTLPQYFKANGYRTMTVGKVYHGNVGGPKKQAEEFDVWGRAGGVGVKPPQKLIGPTPMGDNPAMDWGVFSIRDEDVGDYQVASWAMDQLRHVPKEQPLFLAAGFHFPHVPCYVSPDWMKLIPDDDRVLPAILDHDRDDTPPFSWYLHWSLPEPRLGWLQQHQQWRNLARCYLASTAFMDAQIGRLLAALKETGREENTVVVVWGDNGWHLGEKGVTGKNTLWEPSTRVPLIFAGPGIAKGGRCRQPAELLDMYPTLSELCGLPARNDQEGISLVPQLHDAAAVRERPAITTHNQGNHTIRSERWRYIHYADGSEEFYDVQQDPHEWTNRVADASLAATIDAHRRWLPKVDVPPAPGSAQRVLTYDKTTDTAVWEGQKIRRGDPVPE